MLFMLVEDAPLLGKKGPFPFFFGGFLFNIEKRFLEKRGAYLLKYLDSFYLFA